MRLPTALLALAVAAAWTGCGDDSGATRRPQPVVPTVTLSSDFPVEAGTDGQAWQWIGSNGGLSLNGRGRYWLTFRASSLRQTRTLYVRTRSGEQLPVKIAPKPSTYLVGPVELDGRIDAALEPKPGAVRASRRDPRYLSVFLSNLRLSREPIAAAPSVGFFKTEYDAKQRPYNWLRKRGTIEIRSTSGTPQAWLHFTGASVDSSRTLVFRSGVTRHRLVIDDGRPRPYHVGPFPLSDRYARLVVESVTPPHRYGLDPRPLSVQFLELRASTRPEP